MIFFSQQLPDEGQDLVLLQLHGCGFGRLSCWLIHFLFCAAMMFPMLAAIAKFNTSFVTDFVKHMIGGNYFGLLETDYKAQYYNHMHFFKNWSK